MQHMALQALCQPLGALLALSELWSSCKCPLGPPNPLLAVVAVKKHVCAGLLLKGVAPFGINSY